MLPSSIPCACNFISQEGGVPGPALFQAVGAFPVRCRPCGSNSWDVHSGSSSLSQLPASRSSCATNRATSRNVRRVALFFCQGKPWQQAELQASAAESVFSLWFSSMAGGWGYKKAMVEFRCADHKAKAPLALVARTRTRFFNKPAGPRRWGAVCKSRRLI